MQCDATRRSEPSATQTHLLSNLPPRHEHTNIHTHTVDATKDPDTHTR